MSLIFRVYVLFLTEVVIMIVFLFSQDDSLSFILPLFTYVLELSVC